MAQGHGGDRRSPYYQPKGEVIEKLSKALKVVVLTPHIREYLAREDPKALYQAESALRTAEGKEGV